MWWRARENDQGGKACCGSNFGQRRYHRRRVGNSIYRSRGAFKFKASHLSIFKFTLTPNHFLIGETGGHFAPRIGGRDSVQSQETMEKSTGIRQTLLAQMATRMSSKSPCQEKVDGQQARCSSRGRSLGNYTQHSTRTLASLKADRSLRRRRWTRQGRESSSREETTNPAYFIAMQIGTNLKTTKMNFIIDER